jgi:hypothetical protein
VLVVTWAGGECNRRTGEERAPFACEKRAVLVVTWAGGECNSGEEWENLTKHKKLKLASGQGKTVQVTKLPLKRGLSKIGFICCTNLGLTEATWGSTGRRKG